MTAGDTNQAKAGIFHALVDLMRPVCTGLDIKTDSTEEFYVDTFHVMKNRKPLFFGAVKIGKRYVSYHLMPVYVEPELLKEISPDLRQRMQGKSCFNFTRPAQDLFKELGSLTEAGLSLYRDRGYISMPPSSN